MIDGTQLKLKAIVHLTNALGLFKVFLSFGVFLPIRVDSCPLPDDWGFLHLLIDIESKVGPHESQIDCVSGYFSLDGS